MGALFGSPSVSAAPIAPPPVPAPPPAPPTPASQAVQAAGQAQVQRAQAASGQGFGGTLLSGPGGASAPKTAKATLGS